MKKLFSLLFTSLFIFSLSAQSRLDSALIEKLNRIGEIDQLAARNAQPPMEFQHLSQEQWEAKKDSIYRAHRFWAEELLDASGFPGLDRVGVNGVADFWSIAQHADFDPDFQKMVLDQMEPEVRKGNASPRLYAFLTDRVRMNTGEKLLYGTQVTYNFITGEAFPLPTEDMDNLNKRREEVGLEPIEEYLGGLTKDHMAMNSSIGGITNTALILFSVLMIILIIIVYVFSKKQARQARS